MFQVPVWRIILSDPLTIVALVGRYPTNQLMVRKLLLAQPLISEAVFLPQDVSGISSPFDRLSQMPGQITYALLTRAPLYLSSEEDVRVRLACVRHAASVRSEPGSNSPVYIL